MTMALHVGVLRPTNMWSSGDGPAWIDMVRERLEAVVEDTREPGWDGSGAPPVSQLAVEVALAVLEESMSDDTIPPNFVPTNDGGLQLEWHANGIDVEVYIEPSGAVSAWGSRCCRPWGV